MFRALMLLGLVALMFCALPALAQPAPGQIAGAVANRYGEPIPGAAVRAEHLAEGFVVESITAGNGTYVITNLPPGAYKVEASVGRHADVVVKKVKLAPGQKLKLNFVFDIKEPLKMDPNYRPTSPGLLSSL